MTRVGHGDTWVIERSLLPGKYPYKFVMDGVWSYDIDMATTFDGENTNNYEEVFALGLTEADQKARKRLLSDGGVLTPEELGRLRVFVSGSD